MTTWVTVINKQSLKTECFMNIMIISRLFTSFSSQTLFWGSKLVEKDDLQLTKEGYI